MQTNDEILFILYLLQIIIGVFGNSLILYLYGFNLITHQKIRPIEVLFINLAFSHIMMILFRGIPGAIQVSNQKIFLSDIACEIPSYVQRVSRGLSLCITSLLSVFQAITISSGNPKWAEFKARAPQCVAQLCFFIWVLNLMIDVVIPLHVLGPRNNTSSNLDRTLRYCFMDRHALTTSKIVFWKSCYDILFVGIMAVSSGYMVLVLYRQHWQVQHMHNTNLNLSASPEITATKVVLLLMNIFACFYSISSIISIIMNNSKARNQWMIHVSVFFNFCYPIVSPFVLFSNDSQIPNCCDSFKKMKKSLLNLF